MNSTVAGTLRRSLIALIATIALISAIAPHPAHAQDTTYPLWIGGKQVTEHNKDNILGDNTVRFDSRTFTLHLNNAHILNDQHPAPHAISKYTRSAVHTELTQLTVDAQGTNTITVIPTYPISEVFTQSSGAHSTVTFTGNGTITLSLKPPAKPYPFFNIPSYGVYRAQGTTYFNGPDITLHTVGGASSSALDSTSGIVVNRGTIHAHAEGGYRNITTVYTDGNLRINGGTLTALTGDISHNYTRTGDDFAAFGIHPTNLFVTGGELVGQTQNILFREPVTIPHGHTVAVSTSALAEEATPWNHSTPLGGKQSPYRYIRVSNPTAPIPTSRTQPTPTAVTTPPSPTPAPPPSPTDTPPPPETNIFAHLLHTVKEMPLIRIFLNFFGL